VDTPLFHLVCVPAALDGAPDGWAATLLQDGDLALQPDASGLDGIDAVARSLGLPAVSVVRSEADAAAQERTVIEHTGSLPLVWLAPAFGDATREWARKRGPMTLLVEVDGALPDEERRRIDRFVAILGRQTE
jgi:hypothetical protein